MASASRISNEESLPSVVVEDARSVAIDRAAGPLPNTKTSHSSCLVGMGVAEAVDDNKVVWCLLANDDTVLVLGDRA